VRTKHKHITSLWVPSYLKVRFNGVWYVPILSCCAAAAAADYSISLESKFEGKFWYQVSTKQFGNWYQVSAKQF